MSTLPGSTFAQTPISAKAHDAGESDIVSGANTPQSLAFKFASCEDELTGYLVKPEGSGPFPVVIWNHGSGKQLDDEGNAYTFGKVPSFYVSHGFVVVFPFRHESGVSPDYSGTHATQVKAMTPVEMLDVRLEDVIAAVEYVKKLPYIDTSRMAMSGLSVGGIETVLASEKGLGMKCFVPFAPGAMSWANPELRTREIAAIKAAKAPVFLLQARNDFSLGPSEVLGAILKQKGSPNQSKVYPDYGVSHEDGHRNFALAGCDIWGADVLQFLDANLKIHR